MTSTPSAGAHTHDLAAVDTALKGKAATSHTHPATDAAIAALAARQSATEDNVRRLLLAGAGSGGSIPAGGGGTIASVTPSTPSSTFVAMLDDDIDAIEFGAGTYTWQDVLIEVDRTSRPLTLRPQAGATVDFVGTGSLDSIFYYGWHSPAKWITLDGAAGLMRFKDIVLAQAGVIAPWGTDHCSFKNLTFQNLSRNHAAAPHPYHSWCFYIAGVGGTNDHLLIDSVRLKAPAVSRDVSGIQIASSGSHGAITITNVLELTNYDYAFYCERPVSAIDLDTWVMTNCGEGGISIRFVSSGPMAGSYSNIHATSSSPFQDTHTGGGTIANGGGNSGI